MISSLITCRGLFSASAWGRKMQARMIETVGKACQGKGFVTNGDNSLTSAEVKANLKTAYVRNSKTQATAVRWYSRRRRQRHPGTQARGCIAKRSVVGSTFAPPRPDLCTDDCGPRRCFYSAAGE